MIMKKDLFLCLFVVSVCISSAYGQNGGTVMECADNLSCPVPEGAPVVCLNRSQLCDSRNDCEGEEDETLLECK